MPRIQTPTASLEEMIGHRLSGARSTFEQSLHEGEEYIRREPVRAVLWAMGAGYLLRLLPIGAVFSAITGLLLTMLRPAALFFAVAKGWEMLQRPDQEEEELQNRQ